jgi:hypothetical protein
MLLREVIVIKPYITKPVKSDASAYPGEDLKDDLVPGTLFTKYFRD